MRTIHTSMLSEVKSVFNSEADNEQYYKILKNSSSLNIYNVELARPIVKKNKGIIDWQTSYTNDLKPLSDLPESKRIEIGSVLESFFKLFKSKIEKFRNIPVDFVSKVMQIPNWDSILVSHNEDYIVIVEWGFLQDKFNRKEGIIETLFPIPNQSILVQIVNENNEPVSNERLKLVSRNVSTSAVTNDKGYAKFGTLTRGESFEIGNTSFSSSYNLKETFICDGRDAYVIKINVYINIQVKVKYSSGDPVLNENLTFKSNIHEEIYNTKKLGKFSVKHKTFSSFFSISDENGKILLNESIPNTDTVYTIIIDDNVQPAEDFKTNFDEEDTSKNTNFLFLNSFDKPIKNLSVSFSGHNFNKTFMTDNNGQITLYNHNLEEITYSFSRYKKNWQSVASLTNDDTQVIKVKPIFPWLWWFIISLLLFLILCCLFADCFCANEKHTSISSTEDGIEEILNPCNVETVSGGSGITRTKHYLGSITGQVVINYDMQFEPDKMEVFYQKNRVASTFSIQGNDNGFVGGNINGVSGEGSISFYYEKDKDDFIEIIITGSTEDTVWAYLVNCPN